MSVQNINREFEILMRTMVEAQAGAQGNIESVLRSLMRVTVNSCATMYGFSADEALKRLNSDGEIIEIPSKNLKQQKENKKTEKLKTKAEEDRRKGERQCASFWKRQQKMDDDKVKKDKKIEKLKKEKECSLINEINSIRDVKNFKNWKKLSAGVKLARQFLDI
jgi:hypothetical protein